MKRFVIVEPYMKGDGKIGHDFSNAVKIFNEIDDNKYEKILVGSKEFSNKEVECCKILSFFSVKEMASDNSWKIYIKNSIRFTFVYKIYKKVRNSKIVLLTDNTFKKELYTLFDLLSLDEDDIIYWGNLNLNSLMDIYSVYKEYYPNNNGPIIRFSIWESLYCNPFEKWEVEGRAAIIKQIFDNLETDRFIFYSDSVKRNEQYNFLLQEEKVRLLPMVSSFNTCFKDDPVECNFFVGFFGGLRECKGSLKLSKYLRNILNETGENVNVIVQTTVLRGETYYEKLVKEAVRINNIHSSRMFVLNKNLSSQEYCKYFNKASVIVLPYNYLFYNVYTSGPFSEAIFAEKPLIVPGLTWMARIIEENLDEYYESLCIKKSFEHFSNVIKVKNNNNLILKWTGHNSGNEVYKFKIKQIGINGKVLEENNVVYESKGNKHHYVGVKVSSGAVLIKINTSANIIGTAFIENNIFLYTFGRVYYSDRQIPAIINEINYEYEKYKAAVVKFAKEWKKINGPKQVANILMGEI